VLKAPARCQAAGAYSLEKVMSWITLTADNIRGRLAKDEIDGYVIAGNQEQDGVDTLAEIISQVTAMVRGKVASNRDNLSKLGPDGTIPDECLFAACTIARDALVGSLPLSEGATEVRKEELRKAHSFLDDVASGKVRIEDSNGTMPEAETTSSTAYGGSSLLDF
jgi:hypothetical protein